MAYGVCPEPLDLWFLTNAVDTAALEGAASSSTLSVERLRDPRVGKKWRTTVNGATLKMTFSPTIPLAVFAVFGLAPYSVPLTLDISTVAGSLSGDIRTGAWTPTRITQTAQALWLNLVERPGLATPMVAEIKLGLSRPGGTIDVGRVWAGDYHWTPTVSHAFGSEQSMVDLSAVQRTLRSGAVLADRAVIQRQQVVRYDAIPYDELNSEVFVLDKTAGLSKQLLFVPNYKAFGPSRYAILGYQQAMNPIVSMTYDRYSKSFNLREAG